MLLDRILKYWPILIAVISAGAMLIHMSLSVGRMHADTDTRAEIVEERLTVHEARSGHEQTAIRLERIEVRQTVIARDVQRIEASIGELSDDVREAMRK